jgi:hypothetical protein
MQESGEVVEARIERVNKGGVKLRVEGASGFIPFRRLAAKRIKAGVEDMGYLVGQTVRAKIVEVGWAGPSGAGRGLGACWAGAAAAAAAAAAGCLLRGLKGAGRLGCVLPGAGWGTCGSALVAASGGSRRQGQVLPAAAAASRCGRCAAVHGAAGC